MTEDEAVKLSHHKWKNFYEKIPIAHPSHMLVKGDDLHVERILVFRKLIKLFMMSLLRVMNVSTLFQNYPQRYENLDSY